MAKWGEGDPRWIVEERPDAINVNNWHWTEKNACGWSQSKFKELFNDLKIENDLIKCKITKVEKCEGEAVANNRKGKLIFFYEWNITLKWKGKLECNGENSVTGKINIPNLSEENEIDEVCITFSVNESTPEADTVKSVIKEIGTSIIRQQLSKYVQCLKAEFSQGMILPSKDSKDNENTKTKDSINNISAGLDAKAQMNNSNFTAEAKTTQVKSDDDKPSTETIKITQMFQCTADELYNALTCNELVEAFTQGPVKLELHKGGNYEFFGGNVHGKFIDIVPNSKIIQTWRLKKWPEGHFSTVTMMISQEQNYTELKMTQVGVPSEEAEATRENWERYYWQALKKVFGFGYFL